MNWQKKISTAINTRKSTNTLRMRTVVEYGVGPTLIHDNQIYRNFSSNDYLGLSQHPDIIRAWQKGAELFGIGSGGSGHINGYTIVHKQLEEALAQWLGYPSALLFTSGFIANQAVITALMTSKSDRIIADRLSHASILEAASLGRAQLRRFRHNNAINLSSLLNNNCVGQQLVVTEGIFSMDGDSAPLNSIYNIVKQNNAWLMVDDAHGIGVVGYNGKGSCDIQGIQPEVLIITFGKGIGISGAAVLCSNEVAQYLLQFARHLIYSTSMPPAQVMALQTAIKIVQSDEGEYRRRRLAQYIRTFREGISQLKMKFTSSHSAIQSLIAGDNDYALDLAQRLRHAGIWVTAIRPPTVPIGSSRLRFTLTAAHQKQDIIALLEILYGIC